MSPVAVVSVIFLLSLSGAAVLFKFFESSALVKSRKYKAGGAIAGFIIIYALLYGSFHQIMESEYYKIIDDYKRLREVHQVSGRIVPTADFSRIVLAAQVVSPDMDGRFSLSARCLGGDESNGGQARIYVIDQRGVFPKYVDLDSLENIVVRIPVDSSEAEESNTLSEK